MMNRFWISSLAAIGISVLSAGGANATLVAGWDFSQYLAPGALTIDGANGANVLSANYSNLDTTGGAGAESAAFGTMFMNGLHGSSDVDPLGANPAFTTVAGSLVSNLTAPGIPQFDSFAILTDEGQAFTNLLSMSAQGAANIVFSANLGSVPQTGSGWALSFGGQTFSGTSLVSVAFSTDGTSYTSFGNVTLSTVDTPFTVAFGPTVADTVYVRLGLSPSGGQPIIDNLALSANLVAGVPEPGMAVLLGLGLALVAGVRRRSA
jgi:hypothetical protein